MDSNTQRLLRIAYQQGYLHSQDPRTKNGAVLYRPAIGIIGKGANRFPYGVNALSERLLPENKLRYLIHAELNAILDAALRQHPLEGSEMYCPWCPCCDCAKAIIQAGIRKVVAHQEMHDRTPTEWRESIEIGIQMMKEAGVEYVRVSGKIGSCDNLFRGEHWEP